MLSLVQMMLQCLEFELLHASRSEWQFKSVFTAKAVAEL